MSTLNSDDHKHQDPVSEIIPRIIAWMSQRIPFRIRYARNHNFSGICVALDVDKMGIKIYIQAPNPLKITFGSPCLPYGYLTLPSFPGAHRSHQDEQKENYVQKIEVLPLEEQQWALFTPSAYIQICMYAADHQGNVKFGAGNNNGYVGNWKNLELQLRPDDDQSWIKAKFVFDKFNFNRSAHRPPQKYTEISQAFDKLVNQDPQQPFPLPHPRLIINPHLLSPSMAILGGRLPGRGNLPSGEEKTFKKLFPILYAKFINKTPPITRSKAESQPLRDLIMNHNYLNLKSFLLHDRKSETKSKTKIKLKTSLGSDHSTIDQKSKMAIKNKNASRQVIKSTNKPKIKPKSKSKIKSKPSKKSLDRNQKMDPSLPSLMNDHCKPPSHEENYLSKIIPSLLDDQQFSNIDFRHLSSDLENLKPPLTPCHDFNNEPLKIQPSIFYSLSPVVNVDDVSIVSTSSTVSTTPSTVSTSSSTPVTGWKRKFNNLPPLLPRLSAELIKKSKLEPLCFNTQFHMPTHTQKCFLHCGHEGSLGSWYQSYPCCRVSLCRRCVIKYEKLWQQAQDQQDLNHHSCLGSWVKGSPCQKYHHYDLFNMKPTASCNIEKNQTFSNFL